MRCMFRFLGLSLLTVTHSAYSLAQNESIRLIIKYKQQPLNSALLKSEISKSIQLPVQELTPMANGAYSLILADAAATHSVKMSKADRTNFVLNGLRQNPNILYVVKDRVGHFKPIAEPQQSTISTPLLSHESQWSEFTRPAGVMLESQSGFRDGAWAYTTGKSSEPVVVAVLDTGVALNESLVNNLVKDDEGTIWGWNFAGNDNNIVDETKSYHGTHVSGIIAGYGAVMKGIGEDLKILTVKIPDRSGMFYESAVINGIYWSVGAEVPGVPSNIHPAKVLNMSFGVDLEPGREIDYCDEALQEAVFYARNKGAVLAVAAGNDNIWEHYNAPAVCNGTIKVASTGPEGLRSYFSNYGPGVTFAAPGGDKRYGLRGGILSTVNPGGGYNSSGFDFYQGTSMATPGVAGIAGLVFAVSNEPLEAEQVEQILYTTTHDFGKSTDANKSCVGKKPCGHGIVDAENAVKTVLAGYDILFSAPKFTTLTSKGCEAGLAKPGISKIETEQAIWIKSKARCESKERYQTPHIQQSSDGTIHAIYGATSYQLDQHQYRGCNVIGYDGVGCFR